MGRPRLSIVVPHLPIDDEVDPALHTCLASLPDDCGKLVIVNDGTGFAVNVNRGLSLARGEFVAVVGNDGRVLDGDVYDLCIRRDKEWYSRNEQRFAAKWGFVPPPTDPDAE